ncbi:MAG TPA: DUF2330 domain-containing protein [Bdellovibrionota bacterium]|nr:DUF2330 domain-containing protein [Bdellovibrionota bacterium]
MKEKVLILFLLFAPLPLFADRGSIPFHHHAHIFEPSQRAFVAWNGKREVLILSTEKYASTPTRVLEISPFPSEPSIERVDAQIFERSLGKIDRKVQSFLREVQDKKRSLPRSADTHWQALELRQHERIGVHDIRVFRVIEAGEFTTAVEQYFAKEGIDVPSMNPELKKIVADYIQDGYRYFAFDLIDLGVTAAVLAPVKYTFNTGHLFYPLRISSLERVQGRTGRIQLIVLTDLALPDESFTSLSPRKILAPFAELLRFSISEIRELNEEIADLFPHRNELTLRVWKIWGRPAEFRSVDIIVKPPPPAP